MKLNTKTVKKLKRDFPIFRKVKGLVYLDNASTTQKPKQVISSMSGFYETSNANIHRGIYDLSQKATKSYDNARKTIAGFINASEKEIVFTRSTTESINFLSYTIDSAIRHGRNEILLTEMEHHSNLVPWQQMARRKGMTLRFVRVREDFTLDLRDLVKKMTAKTALLSIVHLSNTLGTVNPIEEIVNLAKKKDIITIVDAAQSVAHVKVDVKKIGCDFMAFSGHKVYGPMGIGVLYGRKEMLEKIRPFNFGGDMIKSVSLFDAEWNTIPERFEAGTQNIEGAIGLGEAIKYIEKIGIKNIGEYENKLTRYALKKLKAIDGVKIYFPKKGRFAPIISLNLKNIHSHDIASLLDDKGICIRAGHHCTMPLMKKLGISGTSRMSLAFYNTKNDIDFFVKALNKINMKFNRKEK